MPKKPEAVEVTAPMKKAMVVKIPLYRAGGWLTPAGSVCHLVLNPSCELSSTRMTTAKMACNVQRSRRERCRAATIAVVSL